MVACCHQVSHGLGGSGGGSEAAAVKPIAKNKHFLVLKVIEPELPEAAIEWVELEAVYSKAQTRIAWRDLRDATQWKQGWV
jgi:tryptophan-rich hypothetical protein